MQMTALIAGGATVAATLAAAITGLQPATASANGNDWGLNGTYIATSNGEWSKTNAVFEDRPSLRSTWTISTQCSYPGECTGTVDSDFGWSAPIYQKSGVWYVKHQIDNWVPCVDGTSAPGLQEFRFAPTTPSGDRVDPDSKTLVGEDRTTGQSGACGINLPVFINMPFKLTKTD
ncbi:hypothetical protein [Mycolicibacterium sp. P9-22]|uniref:hypothetical protein n=1 Tax=Mycolicibacterium sp. P9-22 TaxID=2024613 RepID=UPI001D15B304|nr:hypothetical protein [Mycolicibacterium sp. P9-22]